MPDKIKINLPPNGNPVDATPVDVNQANEQWNTYLLGDNSVLKVKLVVTRILRIDNAFDVDGNPVYVFQSTNVTSVTAPENLKKKG